MTKARQRTDRHNTLSSEFLGFETKRSSSSSRREGIDDDVSLFVDIDTTSSTPNSVFYRSSSTSRSNCPDSPGKDYPVIGPRHQFRNKVGDRRGAAEGNIRAKKGSILSSTTNGILEDVSSARFLRSFSTRILSTGQKRGPIRRYGKENSTQDGSL